MTWGIIYDGQGSSRRGPVVNIYGSERDLQLAYSQLRSVSTGTEGRVILEADAEARWDTVQISRIQIVIIVRDGSCNLRYDNTTLPPTCFLLLSARRCKDLCGILLGILESEYAAFNFLDFEDGTELVIGNSAGW